MVPRLVARYWARELCWAGGSVEDVAAPIELPALSVPNPREGASGTPVVLIVCLDDGRRCDGAEVGEDVSQGFTVADEPPASDRTIELADDEGAPPFTIVVARYSRRWVANLWM